MTVLLSPCVITDRLLPMAVELAPPPTPPEKDPLAEALALAEALEAE